MKLSKRNKWLGLSVGIILSGCATSSFRILFQNEGVAELSTTPDRVLLECQDLYDSDIQGLSGFMVHVLDSASEVTTLVQGNTLSKDDCERHLKGVNQVLRGGRVIYLAGRGNLTTVSGGVREKYAFPGKGTFPSSGKSLGFAAISNDTGLCFDAYSGIKEEPCPPEPFPFWTTQKRTGP